MPMLATAKTITLTSDNNIDYNFTRNYKLNFINGVFSIDKIQIKPFVSVYNTEYNLSSINKSIILEDNNYNWHFGFNINSMVINQIDYIVFNMEGLKKYDSISYTDGKLRVIFEDLIDKGDINLMDNKVYLYNPTTLNIDPVIELLPNSSNKAYKNTTTSSNCSNIFIEDVEFTSINYLNSNSSNNVYYSQTAFTSLGGGSKCNNYIFTFNTTRYNLNISLINSIKLIHEGYYKSLLGDSLGQLYYYNYTSSAWVLWTTLSDSETNHTKTFTKNYSDVISSNNITRFAIKLIAIVTDLIVTTNTDVASIIIDYGETENTCTYSGSGDWFININDNCTLSTSNTVNGMIQFYGSNGFCDFQANQYAHSFYYNVTNLGIWYYNNYRWVY